MAESGVVAILFTDLVRSTELLDRLGDEAADEVRRAHFELLRRCLADSGGVELKNIGDGLMVSFASPLSALQAAAAMQRAVAAHNREKPDGALAVRIGVHVGEPVAEGDDYFGSTVVVARRLCDAAAGGQILVSEVAAGVVGRRGDFRFRRLGPLRLKGLARPVPAVALEWETGGIQRPVRKGHGRRYATPVARGPRLVGRDAELAVLEEELRSTSAGEFRCVLLLGDAGMGKTRLASEVVSRHAGAVIPLVARAFPFGQTAAFSVWSEALERHLRQLDPYEVMELCGGFLDDLASLLRSVAAVRGSVPDHEPPRFRLLDGLAVLVANLAREAPVVVVLDDMHVADASSWETLHYLAHNLVDAPVLAVAAARPAELGGHPAAVQVVGGLEQDGQLRRLTVGAIDPPALSRLCEAVLDVSPPPALVEWLDHRARGNPLFAIGLLGALVDEGADLSAPRLRKLPEGLAERVASRLDALDPAAVDTVEMLAVAARPLDVKALGRLTNAGPERLADLVHRLITARLVSCERRDNELRYELAHPLLQEVVYERMGPVRQQERHRLVGRALLEAGRVAEAAPHFARSAQSGDAEAISALRDALRHAEQAQAHVEALEILAALVDVLPSDDNRWLDIVDALSAQADWTVDQRVEIAADRAIMAMRRVDAVLERSPDVARRAAIKYRLARLLAFVPADFDGAASLADAARTLFVDARDPASALMAAAEVLWFRGLAGDWATVDAELPGVLAAADNAGDPLLGLYARVVQGRCAIWRGRFAEADAAWGGVVALSRAARNDDHLTYGLGMAVLSLAFGGRLTEVWPVLAEGKSLADAWRRHAFSAWEAAVHWLAGDFPAAVTEADALVASRPQGVNRRRAVGLVFAALAAGETGQTGKAQGYLARARSAYGEQGFSFYAELLPYAEANVASWSGRRSDPLGAARRAADALISFGVPTFSALVLLDVAELAAGASGGAARDEARRAADDLETIAAALDRDLFRAAGRLGRGFAHAASGDAVAAAQRAEEAAALFAALGYRAFLGRAEALAGTAWAGTNRQRAMSSLEAAAATFEACGALRRREHVLAALRGLGARGRKAAAARAGPASLTRRERDVAHLAAEGRATRDIAAALFIGERTVEGHLASVYAKLGIASKLDLVRLAADLDL